MDFFGVGVLEALVILVVALLVLGPEQLPRLAYKLGAILQQARQSIAEARDTVIVDMDLEKVTAPERDTGDGDAAHERRPPSLPS